MQVVEQAPDVQAPPKIQQLPHGLHRLVEDCFDEEQYDHAISLIDELRAESIRPSESQMRKVFALSLCSLPAHPAPTASTSKVMLDRDPARPEAAPRRRSKLSRSKHRPSQYAVSTSSRLLLQLGKSWLHPTVASADRIAQQDVRLARYVLACLPSHAEKDASSSGSGPNKAARWSTRNAAAASEPPEECDESTPLARWMQERFETAEDVWDLLSGGQTAPLNPRSQERRLIDEFWMSERERRTVAEQVEARSPWPPSRLGSGLSKQQQRRIPRAPASSDSYADSGGDESMNVSDDYASSDRGGDNRTSRCRKAAAAARTRSFKSSRTTRASTRRDGNIIEDDANGDVDSDGNDSNRGRAAFRLTEGAWRTLRVLVELWQSGATADEGQHRSCFVEQFPPSERRRRLLSSPSRQHVRSGALVSDVGSSEVRKALDVAFSFAAAIPTLWWRDSPAGEAERDEATAEWRRAQLAWRWDDAEKEREEATQRRVEAASSLLALMFAHARRNLLDRIAVVRGTALRLSSLDLAHVRCLTIKLQRVEPGMLALSLLAHLALITGSSGSNSSSLGSSSSGRGSDSSQYSTEEIAIHLHGMTFQVRKQYTAELTSANRVRSAFRRLAREDDTFATVRGWLDDPRNAALYRQTDLFAPTHESSDDADAAPEDNDEGLPWFAYRSLMRHDKREAASSSSRSGSHASGSRDTAHRIAALLRLHTITEHVRTIHVKWFILLCLMEMHQQATSSDADDLTPQLAPPSQQSVPATRSSTDKEGGASIEGVIDASLSGLQSAFKQDVEEMELAVEAMLKYDERARSGSSQLQSPVRDGGKKAGKKDEHDVPTVAVTAERCAEQVKKVKDLVAAIEVLQRV